MTVIACALAAACASSHPVSGDGGRPDLGAGSDGSGADACVDEVAERASRCGPLECLEGDGWAHPFVAVPCPELSCARLHEAGPCGRRYPYCTPPLVTFGDDCGCGCIDPNGTLSVCRVSDAGSECGAGEFCDAPCVRGSGVGLCRDRPESCEARWEPACSCGEELLFANACEAQRLGRSPTYLSIDCETDSCGAFGAHGVGDCDTVLGFVSTWDGNGCVALRGCVCEDCRSVSATEEECVAIHRGRCGQGSAAACRSASECPDWELCHFPFEDPCGAGGTIGTCRPKGCGQLPTRTEPVCGCDGVTYSTACDAWHWRWTIAHDGPC